MYVALFLFWNIIIYHIEAKLYALRGKGIQERLLGEKKKKQSAKQNVSMVAFL